MKRHEKLIPLSREHHQMLLLAQLLKINAPEYQGMPRQLPEKLEYAARIYEQIIKDHFIREEKILFTMAKGASVAIDLIEELEEEHKILGEMFEKIINGSINNKENVHNLAVLLEKHIRKEERQLFQILQNELPLELLEKLNLTTLENP